MYALPSHACSFIVQEMGVDDMLGRGVRVRVVCVSACSFQSLPVMFPCAFRDFALVTCTCKRNLCACHVFPFVLMEFPLVVCGVCSSSVGSICACTF